MIHRFDLRTYPVVLGDLDSSLPELLDAGHYSRIFLIADQNTAPLVPAGLKERVYSRIELEAGEAHKNLAGCRLVWDAMLKAKLDRQSLVLNFGGGVIGDLGGFCAATFKRGVPFIQIPTTLLAMTDAAIGGKLAVDFHGIKNTIGVFQNPAAVLADPRFLHTLPERELRSGFAELLKHALIGDPDLWDTIQKNGMPAVGAADWAPILQASISVKVRIVEADPLEKGLRALLNFGHTIGHALESYYLNDTNALTHGEAVAMGMLTEYWLCYGEDARMVEMISVIQQIFPWRDIPEEATQALWALMQQDKKNAAGTVRMAVPAAETGAMRLIPVEKSDLARALAFYRELRPD